MFRLYRATIRPYLKNRSISHSITSVYKDVVVITYAVLFFFTMRLKTSVKPLGY